MEFLGRAERLRVVLIGQEQNPDRKDDNLGWRHYYPFEFVPLRCVSSTNRRTLENSPALLYGLLGLLDLRGPEIPVDVCTVHARRTSACLHRSLVADGSAAQADLFGFSSVLYVLWLILIGARGPAFFLRWLFLCATPMLSALSNGAVLLPPWRSYLRSQLLRRIGTSLTGKGQPPSGMPTLIRFPESSKWEGPTALFTLFPNYLGRKETS